MNNLAEAKTLLEAFAQYDLFQLKHNIKPDFSNAGGLMFFSPACKSVANRCDGWTDFYNEDGDGLDEFTFETLRANSTMIADDGQLVRTC